MGNSKGATGYESSGQLIEPSLVKVFIYPNETLYKYSITRSLHGGVLVVDEAASPGQCLALAASKALGNGKRCKGNTA